MENTKTNGHVLRPVCESQYPSRRFLKELFKHFQHLIFTGRKEHLHSVEKVWFQIPIDVLLQERETHHGFLHRCFLVKAVEVDIVLSHGVDEGGNIAVFINVGSDFG